MCSSPETVIDIDGISKFFEIYRKPSHRLWQMIYRGKRRFYEPFWALRDISFSVRQGECVGVIGRNGAGKSTLLQILTGTLTPSSGHVTVKGRVAALLELGSGFNPEFTGRENIYLNASILGLSQKEIEARYDDIVAFADIGEFIAQPVKSYSSGMVVRLAFAVVAHVDADMLIIDEALAVGDAFFTQKCMRFLRRFMENKTIIFVSHDIAAVNSLCDRAVLLENGGIKILGTAKEVTDIYLQDMYESAQGKSAAPAIDAENSDICNNIVEIKDVHFRDMRQDMLSCPPFRNDIHIFKFNKDGTFFGKGGCSIEQVLLYDEKNTPLNWVVGGEIVTLHIFCLAHIDMFSPIVGFHFKDRLGQILFGDNTFLSHMENPLHVRSGQCFTAGFTFRMPILERGDYSIGAAVAEGTQTEHVQHQWRHDALMLTSVSTSLSTGIMGIPMTNITLAVRASGI